MIKRKDEQKTDLIDQMRGGKGTVEINHVVSSGDYKGRSRMIARIQLNPGTSIGYHQHTDEVGKVNWTKFLYVVRLSYLNAWDIINEL